MNSYRQLVGHTQANTLRRAKHQGRKLTPGAPREQAWPRGRAQASSSMVPSCERPPPRVQSAFAQPHGNSGQPLPRNKSSGPFRDWAHSFPLWTFKI